MCVYVCTCVLCLLRCLPAESKRGYQIPGAGVTGGCGSPDMGDGNQTQVTWKSSKRSQVLSHLFRP